MGATIKKSEGRQIDYMCKTKCMFGRMHSAGVIYSFPSDIKPPSHFEKLGPHKEDVSFEAQISVLREEIEELKEQLAKSRGGRPKKEVSNEETI